MLLKQEELQQLFSTIMEERGKHYQKNKNIFARKAKEGEEVITNTSDGEETRNIADANDYIITNQTEAKEEYIISEEKFNNKYQLLQENPEGVNEYKSTGKICAVELTESLLQKLDLPATFHFIASWKEEMIAKKSDYLAQPFNSNEIYRIARKEFFETYNLIE